MVTRVIVVFCVVDVTGVTPVFCVVDVTGVTPVFCVVDVAGGDQQFDSLDDKIYHHIQFFMVGGSFTSVGPRALAS